MKKRRQVGKIRVKLAMLLRRLIPGLELEPEDIWQNNYPAAKYLDLCRWGANVTSFLR